MTLTRLTRPRRVGAVLVTAAAALLVLASSASAHAQLEGSDPQPGEVVAVAPRQVSLTFGQPVEHAARAIEVFDDHLHQLRTGPVVVAAAPDGTRLSVSLAPTMGRGTYTVIWRVSSTDTHPVSGSFRFSVGAPSTVTGRVHDATRNDVAGLLLGVMREFGYLGLALGPGLLLVVLALWRQGLLDGRTKRLLWAGVGLLASSTVGGMLFQGVWASGQSLSAIWSSPDALNTNSRRFDQIYAVRCFLVVSFAIALAALIHRPNRPSVAAPHRRGKAPAQRPAATTTARQRWLLPLVAALSAALMSTWAFEGHASTGSAPPVAVAVNLVHLMALSTWLGGLALVAICLSPRSRAAELASLLPGFSRLAFGCVVAIVLSGTYLAWREVGSIPALTSTQYGRLLLVKLMGVLALIAVGNLGRRWVQRHLPSAPRRPLLLPIAAAGIVPVEELVFRPQEYGQPELARLRRGLFAELAIAGSVLALTSALVIMLPARQDFVAPFHQRVTTAALRVDLDVASPRLGDAVLRVTVHTADGRPAPLSAVHATITQTSLRLGPLTLQPVSKDGASTSGMAQLRLTLPARGVWTLRLIVQTSPVDATALSAQLTVS